MANDYAQRIAKGVSECEVGTEQSKYVKNSLSFPVTVLGGRLYVPIGLGPCPGSDVM